MKKAVVTIGPRGAGKSTFCHEHVGVDPSITLIERDAILTELFGSAELSPYTGEHQEGFWIMMDRVRDIFDKNPDVTLILDTWNGYANARKDLVEILRVLGAEYVIGWYFVTPVEKVISQFVQRSIGNNLTGNSRHEEHEHYLASACRRDYALYHSEPVDLDQGFNAIHRIDPFCSNLPPLAALLT